MTTLFDDSKTLTLRIIVDAELLLNSTKFIAGAKSLESYKQILMTEHWLNGQHLLYFEPTFYAKPEDLFLFISDIKNLLDEDMITRGV